MASFTANRTLRISLHLQSRTLSISSLAKKGDETSGPVRYVPMNHTDRKNPRKSPPLQNNGKKREMDTSKLPPKFEEFAKSCDIYEQVDENLKLEDDTSSDLKFASTDVGSEFRLHIDKTSKSHEDNMARSDELLSCKTREDAHKLAIGLLASRAFTGVELYKKLRSKNFPPSIVESVMMDIKCRGLLNDGLYAESFSRSRWLSSTWGPRRIRQSLIQKGVCKIDVEKALKQVFEGDDIESDGQNTHHGMSKVAMDHLFVQASKQWLRGESTSPENRKARIIRWLQYRGFNWGVTSFILKKLEVQYPP